MIVFIKMSLLNECAMSEWLSYQYKTNNNTNPVKYDWAYTVKKNCCIKPQIITSYDGNRSQHCLNCGWFFYAQ